MIHGIMKQLYHNVMGSAVWIFHVHACQTHDLELCANSAHHHLTFICAWRCIALHFTLVRRLTIIMIFMECTLSSPY